MMVPVEEGEQGEFTLHGFEAIDQVRNIPGKSIIYVRWIVQGSGEVSIHADSVKGGTDFQTVLLESTNVTD